MFIIHVVGARPNFMKAAPVIDALAKHDGVTQYLVHTGQHYDRNMSAVFFDELGLPEPDINLEVGSGSHAQQTAEIMQRFEPIILDKQPDWLIVYGDVNSTIATTLVATKMGIKVAHVEAGLRSNDRRMPEELNRLVTDRLADLLLSPSQDGDDNLLNEGVSADRIELVGNVMIDTLARLLPQAETHWPALKTNLKLDKYGLVTLHRPSNVDGKESLSMILETLNEIGNDLPLLFPAHPRTRARINSFELGHLTKNIQFIDPVGYLDIVALQKNASVIITDSGGIQEESTYLGVPCLTVRENTERPITITVGTNVLIGQDMQLLRDSVKEILAGTFKNGRNPDLWDGHAGERIAKLLVHS
ncbi:MAG: non-hydrolyzing UDP-N-acetylglucosamine 2-epimerase [Anaerolineae bacterium]